MRNIYILMAMLVLTLSASALTHNADNHNNLPDINEYDVEFKMDWTTPYEDKVSEAEGIGFCHLIGMEYDYKTMVDEFTDDLCLKDK